MRLFRIALLAAGMLSVVSLRAQTVDEIVNKYIEAMGGKDKVGSMNTLYSEYDVDMNGMAATGANWVVNGKGFKNEISFMGQSIVQCYTDTSGWMINPFGGSATPTAIPPDLVKASQGQLDMAGPLYNYYIKGNTIELAGKETVDGKTAFKLKVKSKTGQESTSWIDATTYYLLKNYVKTTVNGMDVETTMSFSNYKKTENGYMIPYTVALSVSPAINLNMTVKKVEINNGIDSRVFEMPKQ